MRFDSTLKDFSDGISVLFLYRFLWFLMGKVKQKLTRCPLTFLAVMYFRREYSQELVSFDQDSFLSKTGQVTSCENWCLITNFLVTFEKNYKKAGNIEGLLGNVPFSPMLLRHVIILVLHEEHYQQTRWNVEIIYFCEVSSV